MNSFIIAARVIHQITRDRRTLAMLFVAPLMIMTLIGLSFPQSKILDNIAPALLSTLAFFFGFLLPGISFLRERSQGTLERLLISPVSRLDIVLGYLFGFLVFALIQTLIILLFTIYVLNVSYNGDLWQILVFQIFVILGAVSLGICISTFSSNEFQVIQFIPVVITPQVFLCGVIWPIEQMPDYLQWLSKILPLTYAVDGLRAMMLTGKNLIDVSFDLLILIGLAILLSIVATFTVRKDA